MKETVDQLCLRLIEQDRLCVQGMDVYTYHLGRCRWYLKKSDQHPISGRYRYRLGSERRTIYRNKLMWIWTHRRIVPQGYLIDHKDMDRLNDDPSNLVLMKSIDSHIQGNTIQQNRQFQYIANWFQFVGSFGREPTIHEEQIL